MQIPPNCDSKRADDAGCISINVPKSFPDDLFLEPIDIIQGVMCLRAGKSV